MKQKIEDIKKPVYVSVKLSNDEEVQKLNKEYLDRDYATDVLSFEIGEEDEDQFYLGDVVVNLDEAKRQAREQGHDLEQEVSELVQHGILHLLGVHHEGDDH